MITPIKSYTSPYNKVSAQNNKRQAQTAFSNPTFGNSNPKNFSKLEQFFIKIAENKTVQKLSEWACGKTVITKRNHKNEVVKEVVNRNYDRLVQYLMTAFSFTLQSSYIINIMRNKEIPQERKETLSVVNGLTFVLPTIGAFTIDGTINKGADRLQKYLKKINGVHFSQKAFDGVKTLKSVIVFTMIYKYASTLVAMPMAEGVACALKRFGVFGKKAKEQQLAADFEKFQTKKSPSK